MRNVVLNTHFLTLLVQVTSVIQAHHNKIVMIVLLKLRMLYYHATQKPYNWAKQLFLLLLLESLMLLDKCLLYIVRHYHSVSTSSTSNHSLSVGDSWWLEWWLNLRLLFNSTILNMLKLGVWSTWVACWSISYLKWYLAIRRLISTANLCRRCGLYMMLHILITWASHCQRHVSLIFLTSIIQFRVRFGINILPILNWEDWIHWGICELRIGGLSVIKPMLLQIIFCINDLLHLLELLHRDAR